MKTKVKERDSDDEEPSP